MKKVLSLVLVYFLSSLSFTGYAAVDDIKTLFNNSLANIYVMNIRTFSANDINSNQIIDINEGEKVGTFTGAAKRLDSLVANGVNTIHLLPITPVGKIKALGTAGSLYAMDDFSSINPQLDDLLNPLSVKDEAKLFVEMAHKKGIQVIVDLPSCGSYDLYLRRPELFEVNSAAQGIIPADWTDVRLFKAKEKDGSLNQDLLNEHKKFIDMVKYIGADGIRADVATIKPYEFWQILISYARKDNPQFLFLAEASPSWTEKIANVDIFTPYDKLLSAGFDSYLGNFMDYENFTSVEDLFSAYKESKKLSEMYDSKKSIILNFATHDDVSPILVGGNYPVQLIWLSATLPGNMYFVNGFMTGDFYTYPYANKKASVSYTDDETYYVHNGKLDIFNFSRRAGGNMQSLISDYALASIFKSKVSDLIHNEPTFLKSNNKNLWAYEYKNGTNKLLVILNHNSKMEETGQIRYRGVESFDRLIPIKMPSGSISYKKGKFELKLHPSDIAVFFDAGVSSQNK